MSDNTSEGGGMPPADNDTKSAPAGEASPASPAGVPSTPNRAESNQEPPASDRPRSAASILMPTVLSLFSIGFVLWLVFAWLDYGSRYSQATDSWKLNSSKMIEITLVAEDKNNLACASDVTVGDLHCGYRGNLQPWGSDPGSDSKVLQPFNTVSNELFLGAGLWTSPSMPKQLPGVRFTVVCNYKVLGAVRTMLLRWSVKGSFDPLKNSVAVGALSDCVIPE